MGLGTHLRFPMGSPHTDDRTSEMGSSRPAVPRSERWRLEPAADAAGILRRVRMRAGLTPPPTPLSPATALVDLCNLGGSVALAEVVTTGGQDEYEPGVDDGSWLLQHVRRQVKSLERWLDRQLTDPHKGRNSVPSLEDIQDYAEGQPPSGSDSGKAAFARLLKDLRQPWGQRILALVRTLRRDARRIRADVVPELRRLGPQSGWLERLDAALRRSTLDETVKRDELAAKCFEEAFEVGLRKAIEEEGYEGEWRFFATLQRDADAYARAILAEERSLLLRLVEGCVAAGTEEFNALMNQASEGGAG